MRYIFICLLCISLIACSKNNEAAKVVPDTSKAAVKTDSAATEKKEWAEMKIYHKVMSETFHPSEDDNFKPIRERAQELADKAKAWETSTPPSHVTQSDELRQMLVKLSTDSQLLANAVAKKKSDSELKKSLTVLHDEFHAVVEYVFQKSKGTSKVESH